MTFHVDQAHLDRFREVISRRLGLSFDDSRFDVVAAVLRQRVEASESRSVDAYIERVRVMPRASAELRTLAELLTVVETFFFRNADSFRALREHVIPDRIRHNAASRRLRILCAGCASGEEPYSVAMVLRETLPSFEPWDVSIVAIDLNPAMLAKAARGRYSSWSLRATSDDVRRKYFREDGREFILDPSVRQMVEFEERNLIDDDSAFWASSYDVILCRNVVMYFSSDTMQRVVERLRGAVHGDGYLFLGHAETLRGVSSGFHLCHSHDTFYYQRRETTPVVGSDPSLMSYSGVVPGIPGFPGDVDGGTSWIDIIRTSSERIAELGAHGADSLVGSAPASLGERPVRAREWELAPALEAMQSERFADALGLLSALPHEALTDPDAMLMRAALLTNSGRLDEARETCSQLLALDELNAGAHYLMALCCEHAGDQTAAAEHDQTAAYLDATFAMPRLHLGLAARRAGDLAAAREQLEQARMLLGREDASRVLLFGGGFSRETLLQLCRAELRAMDGGR